MNDTPYGRPTAVLVRRYVAHLIDVLVYVVAGAVPFFLLGEEYDGPYVDTDRIVDAFRLSPDYAVRFDDQVWLFSRTDLIVIGAVLAGVALLFSVIIQGRFGWTVGKALTGLRTVNRAGDRPGIGRALVRTVFLVLDALPAVIVALVGGVVALVDRDNRRVGDLVGGTLVVGKDDVGRAPTDDGDLDTSGWEPVEDRPAPVSTLGEGDAVRVGGAAAAAGVGDPDGADDDDAPADDEPHPSYQPQWDPARQAYLQWHPKREVWLQFDDDSGEWQPIS